MAEGRTDAAGGAIPATRTHQCLCVVGTGTVGLHRAAAFDEAGFDVVAYDVDDAVIEACQRGNDPTRTVSDERVAAVDCTFTTDPATIARADDVFVSVPTELDDRGRLSLEAVVSAAETIGENLERGTIVVLESTVYPGATEEVFVPALESTSGLTAGHDFDVAYSPERLSPGFDRPPDRVRNRLIGAFSTDVTHEIAGLYDHIVGSTHVVDDVRTAEAAKCVENVHRDVNIALANEFARSLGAMGLDPQSVLDAAATKWNVPRYRPGPVGGNCLPVDPYFFLQQAERAGQPSTLVRLARAINEHVPANIARLACRALDDRREQFEGALGEDERSARLLVLGLAYKPESSALTGTPSVEVVSRIQDHGVEVVSFDPHVDSERASDLLDVDIQDSLSVSCFDGLLVLVGHQVFETLSLETLTPEMSPHPAVIDVPGVFDAGADPSVDYRGVGDVR